MNIRRPDVVSDYLRHKEINNYLDYIGRRYYEFVTVVAIGKTYEGRSIKAIKIDLFKSKSDGDTERPWIFIEAGTHAREWTTISFALYCIHQLTEKMFRNKELLERARFIIVPLVNADGYEFSHEKNSSWRKNRRPIPKSKFVGVDCNRNYNFEWEGGSKKKSKNTYCGETPFSEPETCAMRNVIKKLQPNLKFFLSLHSCAQTIMYPWGYTKELPPNWKNLHNLAVCGQKAIYKASGRLYRCGNISKIARKTVSGSIADYAFGAEKIPFVLVMELSSNRYGFQPPRDKIEAIVTESWVGVSAMCKRVMDYNTGKS